MCRSVAWQIFIASVFSLYVSFEFVRQSPNEKNSVGALALSGLARVSYFFEGTFLDASLFFIPTVTAFSWCPVGIVCCIWIVKHWGVATPLVTECNIDPFFGGGARRRPSASAFEELRGQLAMIARKLEELAGGAVPKSGTKPPSAKK